MGYTTSWYNPIEKHYYQRLITNSEEKKIHLACDLKTIPIWPQNASVDTQKFVKEGSINFPTNNNFANKISAHVFDYLLLSVLC